MKLFLDDERQPPVGWVLVKTAHEAIQILTEQEVVHVSLDHDLGPEENGTGYDVLLWIEEQVATAGYRPPVISIHTANTSAFVKMTNAVSKITQLARQNDV